MSSRSTTHDDKTLTPVSSGKYSSTVGSTKFKEKVFTSSTYHAALLEGFSFLRENRSLCDVTLIADGEYFYVHRVLLAACSPYFRELFSKDKSSICKPSKTDSSSLKSEKSDKIQKYTWFSETIELRGVTTEGLSQIVDFIYTGKIPISMTSVQNILVVARHMEITPVLDFCSEFLTTAIDLHTCVDIIHIAEVFSNAKLGEIWLRVHVSCFF